MEKIPMLEPIKDVKEFASVDEFNVFYNENKKKFEELTTCKLNKMYKIPGYRITKIKGVPTLKNIPESKITFNDRLENMSGRVSDVEDKLKIVIQRMNDLIEKVNELGKRKEAPPPEKPKKQPIPQPQPLYIEETPLPQDYGNKRLQMAQTGGWM